MLLPEMPVGISYSSTQAGGGIASWDEAKNMGWVDPVGPIQGSLGSGLGSKGHWLGKRRNHCPPVNQLN